MINFGRFSGKGLPNVRLPLVVYVILAYKYR